LGVSVYRQNDEVRKLTMAISYVPEILPLHARAKGTAIGISANWLFNFLVVMISPSLINGVSFLPSSVI